MEEFTILELFVLLTVLEKAHEKTCKNPLFEQGLSRESVELEQRIIEKLRHIRQKHTDAPETIVLREVLAGCHTPGS